MSRPSISLCMIVKNEAHNLGPLLQSVRGCVDQIVIVDTGSTDNTVEVLEKINKHVDEGQPHWSGIPHIDIEHFDWVDDFAAARNYSFSFAKSDYVFWLDADDVLSDAKAFIHWRDNVMHSAHYWLAIYNYGFNAKGECDCSFVRERVIKRNHGFVWLYPVHEGLVQTADKSYWPNKVHSWWVNHARSEEDRKNDHLRNVKLLEKLDSKDMPARMKFYQGKELVENGFIKEGAKPLMEAIASGELDIHDRILAIQYAAQSAFHSQAYGQAVDVLFNGLKLMPSRAEYWCLLGDTYLAMNKIAEASQSFRVALNCTPDNLGGIVVVYGSSYKEHPLIKLTEISMATGNFTDAEFWLSELKKTGHAIVDELQKRLDYLVDLATIREGLPKTDDVVITCPPQGVVTDWDEHTLANKGCGGSETAAIEVAKWIKKKTGRNVKVFQPRQKREVMPSGVEYLPSSELGGYIRNVEPYAHIAWRHTTRITKAKTYVWCHDLQVQGADQVQNFDKIIALSQFHKEYLKETQRVPDDRIVLGFNGIDPDLFLDRDEVEKDNYKIVFSSSPDRGLVQSIQIVKKAREISGLDLKLHCFYGTENMRKMGHAEWADKIEAEIKANDFVVYHGFVNKKTLMHHFMEAAVWLYPADFIETYCITALEALCAGAYPIVRDMGALKYTMAEAINKGMCDVLAPEVKDDASTGLWANRVVDAVLERKYKKVNVDPRKYSWETVGDFFIKELSL